MQPVYYSYSGALVGFLIGYAICWYASQKTDRPLWPRWPL